MDSEKCEKKCPFLKYDEKKSFPSAYIGEGYYVYDCIKYNRRLTCYLAKPLKLTKCKEESCQE